MSKREEAIEAMARALNPALWGAPHGDVLTNAMRGRALEHAAAAFDAAIQVLMEPDEAMMEAAAPWPAHWPKDGPDFPMMRAAVRTDQMSAAGNFRTMLKAASA